MEAAAAAKPLPGVARIADEVAQLGFNPEFGDRVRHHWENLQALRFSLTRLGFAGEAIDQHLTDIFSAYKTLLHSADRLS